MWASSLLLPPPVLDESEAELGLELVVARVVVVETLGRPLPPSLAGIRLPHLHRRQPRGLAHPLLQMTTKNKQDAEESKRIEKQSVLRLRERKSVESVC